MALPVTSGTAAFLLTRDDVITAALRTLKVIAIGETPATEDFTNCAIALQSLLKELNIENYFPWTFENVSIPFVASKASYTIAESGADVTNVRPVKILHAWRRDGSTPAIDTPMSRLSKQEYDQMTPKLQTGVPTNWFFDALLGASTPAELATWYVWPAPLDTTYTGIIAIQRPIYDIASSSQNLDLTQEWFSTIRWLLADEVGSEYEVDLETLAFIQRKAEAKRKRLADFAQEDASILVKPDPQMAYGSRFNS